MPPSSARCKGLAVLSINGNSLLCPRKKWGTQIHRLAQTSIVKRSGHTNAESRKSAWQSTPHAGSKNATAPLKYLAAERSEDGASGRYTTPWGSERCRNHCSNHSGFLTGADTFVRTTLLAMAPGGHAISERLSFGYFSLARQRKVTAAPRRGDANRPTRSQVLHAKRGRTTKQTKSKPNLNPSRARRAPLREVRCPHRSASRATLFDLPEA